MNGSDTSNINKIEGVTLWNGRSNIINCTTTPSKKKWAIRPDMFRAAQTNNSQESDGIGQLSSTHYYNELVE